MDQLFTPMPPELIPQLAESSADLLQYGILTNQAEIFARDRALNKREFYASEQVIEERLGGDTQRQLTAVKIGRSAATDFPEAFDAAVSNSLDDTSLASGIRERFDAALGVVDGNYAGAALAACDRLETTFLPRPEVHSDHPSVSGGDVTGCDLIALGSMLGGATCVIGCGPCCIVGAGGALLYVGACTG